MENGLKKKKIILSYREVRATVARVQVIGRQQHQHFNDHDTCILTLAFQTQKTMQQIIHQ